MYIPFIKHRVLIIACALLLTACQKGRTYFPKEMEPQQVDIVRFDNALLNVHEASVAHDIRVLYDEYPKFMPLWVEDILGIPSVDTAYTLATFNHLSIRRLRVYHTSTQKRRCQPSISSFQAFRRLSISATSSSE